MNFLLEFLPLIIFLVIYKFMNSVIYATGCLVISTLLSLIIFYKRDKKIAIMPLISAIILTVFGLLTVINGDDIYIKMKPTILNLFFGISLMLGLCFKKGLLKYALIGSIKMDEQAWCTFSWRWGLFFIAMAFINEIVWRNFSLDTWMLFKVFGFLPLSILFTLVNFPFLKKHAKFGSS